MIVFTAVVGMVLAAPGLPPLAPVVFGTLGIALAATSAAAINHVLDRHYDQKMARTRHRPIPTGHVSARRALGYAAVLGAASMIVLATRVNVLTAALTFASLIGYAVLYTVWLKHATPQNIVIGGAAGAAPPVLGWTAVTGQVEPHALLLFLIIFAWTPPHFWALAIARRDDYAKAGIPMLPVAYGVEFTRLQILLYTILLVIVTVLPYITGMTGLIYLAAALAARPAVHPARDRLAEKGRPGASADAGVPVLGELPDAALRGAAARPLRQDPLHARRLSGMAQRPHLAAPLLLAVAVLLILYVSLYPFRFAPDGPSMLAAVELLTWARASRGDMLNNVLLYMPLGFCVALIVEPRFGRAAAMGAALIAGAALSLSMELLQASIAPRVPSLTDLTLNAVGALAGTLGGSAWHAFGSRIAPQGAPVNRARAVAALIVALWLVMRLWPLLPDASLGQLKRAVRPLFTPHIRFAETAALPDRLADRCGGGLSSRAAPARGGRPAGDHRGGAGRAHLRRRQHAHRRPDRRTRAATAIAAADQPPGRATARRAARRAARRPGSHGRPRWH